MFGVAPNRSNYAISRIWLCRQEVKPGVPVSAHHTMYTPYQESFQSVSDADSKQQCELPPVPAASSCSLRIILNPCASLKQQHLHRSPCLRVDRKGRQLGHCCDHLGRDLEIHVAEGTSYRKTCGHLATRFQDHLSGKICMCRLESAGTKGDPSDPNVTHICKK